MERMKEDIQEETRLLIDEYRHQCLWFIRPDYYPDTAQETLRIMDYICRYGDARGYRKAQEIRKWHLQNTKSKSAGCSHQTAS